MNEESLEDIQRDASEIINAKINAIKILMAECEALATESGVTFYLDLGQSNYFDGEYGHWQSSSSNC